MNAAFLTVRGMGERGRRGDMEGDTPRGSTGLIDVAVGGHQVRDDI